MIVRKDRKKVREGFSKGAIDEIEVIVPNISDYVMKYADEELKLNNLIDECITSKFHSDGIPSFLFIYGLISAKLKRLFSVSDSVFAITTESLINKYDLNFVSKKEFTCEGNMRKFINKIGSSDEITDEQLQKKIKEIEYKNKLIKDDNKKIIIDEKEIRNELQIKQNGHKFVTFFNAVTKKIIEKIDKPKIHILDCVKQPVNIKNSNFELSTVINYEGKPMRGYKMGVLRCVTETGNSIIEYLIDDTLSKNDMSLVEDEITNYDGFSEGDYLLADRGFAKIEFIVNLVKRDINVIIPVKKNMDIFKECVKLAQKNNSWQKHPNPKRKGQEIMLINNLKGLWISEKDKNKKPEKMMDNAIDFSACVIRIEKDKNKDLIKAATKIDDDTDAVYEDDKYIYLVITSTNTNLTAAQIIRYYEMRPEIEEDFRQLKDIWKMCTFTSTKYVFVMCQICMTFLAYNLFNMFKTSEKGIKFLYKSIKKISAEEQRDRVPFNETNYLIVSGEYYDIFSGIELLDLYAACPKKIQEKIKSLIT
jgi:hypothetical protein